eukprot:Gb_14078 [translate_table: standard]
MGGQPSSILGSLQSCVTSVSHGPVPSSVNSQDLPDSGQSPPVLLPSQGLVLNNH